jgi:hypothetical protein
MAENNAVVGVHNPHAETEAIIKEFQRSGFDNKLSIVGKDFTPFGVSSRNGKGESNDIRYWK